MVEGRITNRMRLLAAIAAAAVSVGSLAASVVVADAAEDGAVVTRGELAPFAAGVGGSVGGRAQMVRTASGATIVSLHADGLAPGATYASHVHAAPCAVGAANGHYKHDPAGAPVPPNEIWPGDGPFVANAAGRADVNAVATFTAGVTAVSVVVHDLALPSTANKVACADLAP